MLWWQGIYTHDVLINLAVAIPAALISAQIGISVFRRLSDDLFRRLLISMCLLSGLILMIRALT